MASAVEKFQRRVEAAKRYAAADRSDPFALARAIAHLRNGIAGSLQNGDEAIYDASEFTETRQLPPGVTLSNGDTAFEVKAYRNITRP